MNTTISGLVTEKRKNQILNYTRKVRKYLKIPKSVKVHIALGILQECGRITQIRQDHYEVWLDKTLSESMLREVIGHELQHARQFLDGRLEIRSNSLFFEGISMASIPYSQRIFELEAKRVGREIRDKILFGKI